MINENIRLEFGTLNKEEINNVTNLLNVVFPKQKNIDIKYITWLYLENPDGKAITFNAIHNNTIIAHYAVIPVNYNLFGKKEKGVWSLNTAVHPNFGGRGLFTKLAKLTYEKASELGYTFVGGIANAASTPGFTKKLGFDLVSELDVFFRNNFKKESNIDFSKTTKTDFQIDLNKKQIKWRLTKPNVIYKIKIDETIKIFNPTFVSGLSICIAEFNIECGFKKIIDQNTTLASRNFFPLHLWIGLSNRINKKRIFDLPKILRPSPLNFIFKDLTKEKRSLDKNFIDISVFDFDAF